MVKPSRNLTAAAFGSALFSFLLAVLFAWRPITDTDAWYHLATGRWILEHRAIPSVDTWSFTAAGRPWITHEWLYELVVYLVYLAGSEPGLVLFRVLCVAGTLWCLERTARTLDVAATVRYPLIAIAAALASFRFTDRPQIATFLLTAATILLLERARREHARPPWMLVPMFWLWGNVHAGVIYGYAVAGAFVLDAGIGLVRAGIRSPGEFLRQLAPTLWPVLAAGVASLVNPHHIWTPLYPFLVVKSLKAAAFTTSEMASAAVGEASVLRVLVAACLVAWLVGVRGRPAGVTLFFCVAGAYALRWIREQAFFFLMIAPFLGLTLQQAATWRMDGRGTPVRRALNAACVLALCLAAVWIARPYVLTWQVDIRAGALRGPDGGLAFHKANKLPANVFNAQALGAYLTWKSPDDVKVFIDGRLDVFPPEVLADYLSIERDEPARREVLAKYDIACCMHDYGERYAGEYGRTLRDALFADPAWVLVYWDDDGTIYLRRDVCEKSYASLPAWSVVDPNAQDYAAYADPKKTEAALEELDRHAVLQPGILRSRRIRGLILGAAGRYAEAASCFNGVLSDPRAGPQDYRSAAYMLDNAGDTARAREAADRGLKQWRYHVDLLDLAGVLHARTGDVPGGIRLLERADSVGAPSRARQTNLAIMYGQLGNKERSNEHLRKGEKLPADS